MRTKYNPVRHLEIPIPANPLSPSSLPHSTGVEAPANPSLTSSLPHSIGDKAQGSGLEKKNHLGSLQRKLNDLLEKTRLPNMARRVTGKRIPSSNRFVQSPSEQARAVEPGPPEACSTFQLPHQSQQSAKSQALFTISDALSCYMRLTPAARRSAQGFFDYMSGLDRGQGEKPVTFRNDALAIYLQLTAVKEQSARGFWNYMEIEMLKRGERQIVIDEEMLAGVILPSIKQQIEDVKNEYKKDGVDLDTLSPSFRKLNPDDFSAPELVPPPPPRPPKIQLGPPVPPKIPLDPPAAEITPSEPV